MAIALPVPLRRNASSARLCGEGSSLSHYKTLGCSNGSVFDPECRLNKCACLPAKGPFSVAPTRSSSLRVRAGGDGPFTSSHNSLASEGLLIAHIVGLPRGGAARTQLANSHGFGPVGLAFSFCRRFRFSRGAHCRRGDSCGSWQARFFLGANGSLFGALRRVAFLAVHAPSAISSRGPEWMRRLSLLGNGL